MSLRNKIFITFSFLLLIPLIIVGLVVQNIFISAKGQESLSKRENTITQLNYNLDLIIDDASRSSLSILYNQELVSILREYEEDTPLTYKKASDSIAFSLFLSSMVFNKDQIYGMHVFTKSGHLFSHQGISTVKNHVKIQEQEWYEKAKEAQGKWIIFHEENPTYYKNSGTSYLSYIRLLRDPIDLNELGVIKIDFSPIYLEQLTEQFTNENWRITDGKNEVIIGSDSKDFLSSCLVNRSNIINANNKQKYLCVTHKSQKTNLKIHSVIPERYLFKEIKEFNRVLFFLIILCLIFSLITSYLATNFLLKPLELLKTRIRNYQQNKFSNHYYSSPKNEILELGIAYDGMLTEIDTLITKVYQTNLISLEAEYKALQAQMDPHFIFNTLESINMQAITNEQYEISDMIAELGKLIRYRLKNEEQQVPIEQEVKFSKSYVKLMKNRMGDSLDVLWEIELNQDSVLVPKYLIQPLIENSINHGFSETHQKIVINVEIKRKDDKLIIVVSDNGVGMKEEKVREINKFINDSQEGPRLHNHIESNSGIALSNINRRLKLLYGVHSKVLINSTIGLGTKVKIILDSR